MIGTKAQFCSFECCINDTQSGGLAILGELDDQNRVLGGEADRRQQSNLEIDVVGTGRRSWPQRLHPEPRRDCHDHREGIDQLS